MKSEITKKIKFLMNSESSAMVQMSHSNSLIHFQNELNNITVFGRKIQIS